MDARCFGWRIVDRRDIEKGMKTLTDDWRPIDRAMSATERGLGVADLAEIDRVEL